MHRGLREFLAALESAGELHRVRAEVSAELEVTEVADRVSRMGAIASAGATSFDPAMAATGGKALLFERSGLAHAVVNADDAFGRELARRCRLRGLTVRDYALRSQAASLAAHDLQLDARGLRLEIVAGTERARVRTRLLGAFNAENLLACAGALLASGLTLGEATAALAHVDAPAGRMQPVRAPEAAAAGLPAVVVDYAHTPDALAAALQALRPAAATGRLHCVFGCGGDRDPGKRAPMGEIAARLADRVWVTSDNPQRTAAGDHRCGARGRGSGRPGRAGSRAGDCRGDRRGRAGRRGAARGQGARDLAGAGWRTRAVRRP